MVSSHPTSTSGRMSVLLCGFDFDTNEARPLAGLLRQAPVEPRKHLSMHVALRTVTRRVVNSRPLSLVGNQLYRVSHRVQKTSATPALCSCISLRAFEQKTFRMCDDSPGKLPSRLCFYRTLVGNSNYPQEAGGPRVTHLSPMWWTCRDRFT